MLDKTCKECGETKSIKEFYHGAGRLCKECKIAYATEHTKEIKALTIKLLTEILEKQNLLLDNQAEILEKVDVLEHDVNKIRKTLKKIT